MNTLEFLEFFHEERTFFIQVIDNNGFAKQYKTNIREISKKYIEDNNIINLSKLAYFNKQYNQHIYFSVNSYKEDSQNRQEKNIDRARFIFFDIDYDEKYGLKTLADLNKRIETLKEELGEPNLIVNSSREGRHIYYRLDKEYENVDVKEVSNYLIKKFNADPKVKDLSRVLRVPNFLNTKPKHLINNEYPKVEVTHLNRTAILNIDRYIELLKKMKSTTKKKKTTKVKKTFEFKTSKEVSINNYHKKIYEQKLKAVGDDASRADIIYMKSRYSKEKDIQTIFSEIVELRKVYDKPFKRGQGEALKSYLGYL